MTDTPNRSIGGLAPRSTGGAPDLSRLQRRNRAVPQPLADHPAARSAVTRPVAVPQPVPDQAPAATSGPSIRPETDAVQDRITVYLDRELRARARTAYRATAHLEGDRTWSDFIEQAIRLEVERREQLHNDGAAYGATTTRLAPGRPIV